jgi:hypothetical protein
MAEEQRRRGTDQGFLCRVALRASQGWDFIDKRAIDKHVLSWGIFFGTYHVTRWAMTFAETSTGSDDALVIASVMAPYMALQAAAMKFYFEARK